MNKPILLFVLTLAAAVSFTVSAGALTADEIIQLKKNGVSDRTIELMVQSGMEEKNREDSAITIEETKSATVYATGRPAPPQLSEEERRNVEQAWEMLKNLSIKIHPGRDR